MAPAQELTRFICLFHTADNARAAVAALENTGVANGGVTILGGEGSYATGNTGSQSLDALQLPERDLQHLQEGLRSGGTVVSLGAPENQSDEIEKIFHHYSARKIDEADAAIVTRLDSAPVPTPSQQNAARDVVLPVVEESLAVGKYAVDRGGVRVYRRTVEEPVQETVDLHGERVVLEYREANRPATEADLRAGSQQIELIETAEVPVVEKVARVVEEVHVGTVGTDRTEVVQDAVRHTEVQVEPLSGDAERPRLTRE